MRFIAPLAIAAAMAGVLSAQARRVTPPQEVATLEDLRPTDPYQIVRAHLLKYDGALYRGETFLEKKTMFIREICCEPDPGRPLTREQNLAEQVCRSTAVAGHAMSSKTFLNAQETGLFTDFQVLVDRWIHPPSGDREILVSMLGGRAIVGGALRIEFIKDYFMETGQRYIMFLHWSAAAKAYLVDPHWVYREPMPIAGGLVITDLDPVLRDERAFMTQLSEMAGRCKVPLR